MPPDAPYRDDREADQARIHALENDLETAKEKIAQLEGRESQALVLAGSRDLTASGKGKTASAKWFGAPLNIHLVQNWDGAFPVDKLEDLLEPIRRLTGDRGRVEMLKTSMTWQSSKQPGQGVGPFYEIRLSVREGKTTLEASERLGPLAGAIFGGIGGGVGGGAIVLPIFASIAMPVLTPVFVVAWVGGFYGGLRAIFRRKAHKRAANLVRMFDQLRRDVDAMIKTAV